jgi:hypothetical protein
MEVATNFEAADKVYGNTQSIYSGIHNCSSIVEVHVPNQEPIGNLRGTRFSLKLGLRAGSHYSRKSRGHRFPPIKLQETKSLASGPFTLWPKSKGRRISKWLLFEEGDRLSKEVWVGREWKPKLWSRGRRFLFIKQSIIDKILAVRLEGLFWARNKVACSFEFGLWAWPLEASHYARPKAPLPIFYWLFSAHFFGLSTKFGHSIAQPLDLDGHSVNRP